MFKNIFKINKRESIGGKKTRQPLMIYEFVTMNSLAKIPTRVR